MGASDFYNFAKGKTAKEAFASAVEEAQYLDGHAGYSGTIAEKSAFRLISLPEGSDPEEYAQQLVNDCDPRIDDKWGPAGCIQLPDHRWLFFGWASS